MLMEVLLHLFAGRYFLCLRNGQGRGVESLEGRHKLLNVVTEGRRAHDPWLTLKANAALMVCESEMGCGWVVFCVCCYIGVKTKEDDESPLFRAHTTR